MYIVLSPVWVELVLHREWGNVITVLLEYLRDCKCISVEDVNDKMGSEGTYTSRWKVGLIRN